jgi:hypothetical protein
MSNDVFWAVGTTVGGNSTTGTISTTGLYTAPTTLPSNTQIQITAIAKSSTKVVGMTWIYLNSPGPKLTSVSPNPLPSGTVAVTFTGTGFIAPVSAMAGGIQLSPTSVTSTTIKASVYIAPGTASLAFYVRNSGSSASNTIVVPVSGTSKGGGTGDGNGGGSGGSAPVVSPSSATVNLGATQQFSATNSPTGWTAVSGTVTSAGLYTAPAVMPASGQDTVTATNATGKGTATVTLVSNTPPTVTLVTPNVVPLGVYSLTIAGSGFTAKSTVQLNGVNLNVTSAAANSISASGFAGTAGAYSLTVTNGSLASQPVQVQVGVQNALVSPAAARRFLEQAAFGPTPADAAHVQAIGYQAWLNEQFAMPVVSNFNAIAGSSQGAMPTVFLTNAVTNPDQLRQRVAFALSQIFVTSITKLIWNGDMIPYQQMLLADAFTNYRQILGDVTLSAAMGEYLDMANNAKANPAAGTVANENYAREIMQLMSIGTKMLNQDGTPMLNAGSPIPTYFQTDVTELARVFTGWTYAGKNGGAPVWGAYINSAGPMVPFPSMHDFGPKNLLNGYVAAANLTPQADLQGALDNLVKHPNVAPFISKQLIQHLVKSNPSPAYVARISAAFTQSNGDMPTVITAILLDTEARANDAGGNDLPTDGHLQEPALLLPGYIRAFGGQMNNQNYYASNMAFMGEDIYNPASVFNYYSPGYVISSVGLNGPEFQIYNPNNTILRENLIATFFNQYSNPVQSYGPGTIVDLTAWLPLAATPATLVDALDFTLTHGTMPAAMKQIIVTAVTADQGGNLHRVETGIYLILTSSYYNVWH